MVPSSFGSFDGNPFFDGHRDRMGQLFYMPERPGIGQLEGREGEDHHRGGRHHDIARRHERPNDMFGSMMNHIQSMTSGMGSVMNGQQIARSPGDGASYMQSSVYSYSNAGGGAPEIYEAHHSNRTGPGGLREEKKALRDTRRQLEKMVVGRHIGERGRVIERACRNGGDLQQHQELVGLGEDDVDAYEREWQDRTREWVRNPRHAAVHDRQHEGRRRVDAPLAIESQRERRRANH